MSDQENDYRPQIPTWAAVGAMVVAVLAVLALVFVLYQRTTGPGEVVMRFYSSANEGDCPAVAELLSSAVDPQDAVALCGDLEGTESHRIESVTLLGPQGDADEATVVVSTEPPTLDDDWHLIRSGDEWLISAIPVTN